MKLTIIVFVIVVIFSLLLRLSENKFVFFPSRYPAGNWQPESYGIQVESCIFSTQDGLQLHGWFLKNNEAIATLLWCHGNAGNITDRLHNLSQLSRLPLNVFIFDYRGYGKSDGSPTESGVYLDARAAYDFLVNDRQIDANKIIIFGRSLGGAVAVDLATNRDCSALILESTFSTAKDMARQAFGPIPVHLIMKTNFDSMKKIRQLHTSVLFIHGTSDRVVPFELGKKLCEAANEPKEFYEVAGGDHNDTYLVDGDRYFQKLRDFIVQVSGDN